MAKRIENPLREGEISKIFFLAYPEYISGYKLSKLLGKDTKEGWIYRVINDYRYLFNIKVDKTTKRSKKLIRSKAEYLIDEIKTLDDKIYKKLQRSENLKEFFEIDFREFCRIYVELNKENIFEEYNEGFSLFLDAYYTLMSATLAMKSSHLRSGKTSFVEFASELSKTSKNLQISEEDIKNLVKEKFDSLPEEYDSEVISKVRLIIEEKIINFIFKIVNKYGEEIIDELLDITYPQSYTMLIKLYSHLMEEYSRALIKIERLEEELNRYRQESRETS